MPIPARIFQQQNRLKPCSVSTCPKNRFACSRYCQSHSINRVAYGHPLARHIEKGEMAEYMKIAKRIITQAQGTRALGEALIAIVGCIAPGGEPWGPDPLRRRAKLHSELQRLADAEVSPGDALIAATGAFLYLQANPRVLPKDDYTNRATEFCVARAVLTLAPLRGKWIPTDYLNEPSRKVSYDLPSTVLAQLGKRIMQQLTPFFVNVAQTVKREEMREAKRIRSMRSPLIADILEKEEAAL